MTSDKPEQLELIPRYMNEKFRPVPSIKEAFWVEAIELEGGDFVFNLYLVEDWIKKQKELDK